MKKVVSYRRVNNKLRTKNRDLARSKETLDRRLGNNGSVSSLGVDYFDSDGDGYKDQVTKTRRAQSLHRDSSYGGSQAMAATYSRKKADTTAPNVSKEIDNATEGISYTKALVDSWRKDSNLMNNGYGGYVNSYYDWPTSARRPEGPAFYTTYNSGIAIRVYKPEPWTFAHAQITVTLKIELLGALSTGVDLRYGTEDGMASASIYAADFPETETGTETSTDLADWENQTNVGGTSSTAGTTLQHTITNENMSASGHLYFQWCLNRDSDDVSIALPVMRVQKPAESYP